MAFRDNSTLFTGANQIDVVANGPAIDVYAGNAGQSDAFVIAAGQNGDDILDGFEENDSLITKKAIFDGNGDGFIAFGPNGVLDEDRTGGGNNKAGKDQLQLVGTGGDLTELRFLGTKGDGNFVYADAITLRNLYNEFGAANVVEGDVSDDATLSGAGGSRVFLYDNNLGLNLGGDTISDFGDDDLLVTTSQIFDRTGNGTITFGDNDVLDLSGEGGPNSNDPTTGRGGQIDFVGVDELDYLGSNTIGDVTYYYYGTLTSTATPVLDPTE